MSTSNPLTPALSNRETDDNALAWSLRDLFALIGVLALSLLLRLTHIDDFPSLDEIWHLGLTAGNGSPMSQFQADTVYQSPPSWSRLESAAPWWSVWSHMDGVLHPPLYCLALRLWRDATGASDMAAHAYSIVWSLVTIAFLFDTARRSMNLTAAVLVGIAMSASRSQIYFAQEIRGYQMMIGIATIALWLMTRLELERVSRRRTVLLAWLPFPMLLTHYFAFGAALAVAVWGMLRLREHRWRFLIHLVASGVLYAIVWMPFALRQIDDIYTGDEFLFVEHLSPATWLSSLLSAPLRTVVDRSSKANAFFMLAGALLILPWFRLRTFRPLLPWAIFLACGLLPLAALDALRSTQHLEFVRYYSVITPAVFLLFAGCLWRLTRWGSYIATGFAILVGSWYTLAGVSMTADAPNLLTQVLILESHLRPNEALIVYPGSNAVMLNDRILMTANHRRGLLNRPVVSLHAPMTQQLQAQLPRKAWLFTDNLQEPLGKITGSATDLPDSFREPGGTFQYIHLDWSAATTQRAKD